MPALEQGFSHNQVATDRGMYAIRNNLQGIIRIYGFEFPNQSDDGGIEIRQVKLGLMSISGDPLSVSCENRVIAAGLDCKRPGDIVERRGFNGSDAEQRAR